MPTMLSEAAKIPEVADTSDLPGAAAFGELTKVLGEQLTRIHELGQQVRAGEQARHDQQHGFLLGLIEILDAFADKEEALRERYAESVDGQQLIKSYATIQKRVSRQLTQHGVVEITFPENRLIVGLTKVVGTEPNATLPNDTILAIIRPGYIRTNEVLRPAEVIVVRN